VELGHLAASFLKFLPKPLILGFEQVHQTLFSNVQLLFSASVRVFSIMLDAVQLLFSGKQNKPLPIFFEPMEGATLEAPAHTIDANAESNSGSR
jgi:hypothetical protein